MKRLVIALLGAVLLAASLVSVTAPAANAHTATPQLKKLAKKMKCKYGTVDSLASDARVKNSWECVVGAGTRNRRTYYLMTYYNTARAIDEWRDWTSCSGDDYETGQPCEPEYFARKGKVIIIDQSNGDSYTYKAAKYAANRTGGRVIAGYRY
jgi:hypothetical protein